MDVHVTSAATTAATVEKLRQSFSTHGLPESIVSDNGPCFASYEFDNFCIRNGIRHILIPPYHPASNGQAERAVQTLKRSLNRQTGGSLETRVSRFLLSYRVTPHTTTGVPPCELLMRRTLRSLLDCPRPDVSRRVQGAQERQKQHHDRRSHERDFEDGERIFCRDFGRSSDARWIPAVVADSNQRWFTCRLPDGREVRRHADHLRGRRSDGGQKDSEFDTDPSNLQCPQDICKQAPMPGSSATEELQTDSTASGTNLEPSTEGNTDAATDIAGPRRSTRARKMPDRLHYD